MGDTKSQTPLYKGETPTYALNSLIKKSCTAENDGTCMLPTRYVTNHPSPSSTLYVYINFPICLAFHTQGLEDSTLTSTVVFKPNNSLDQVQFGPRLLWHAQLRACWQPPPLPKKKKRPDYGSKPTATSKKETRRGLHPADT